MGVVDNKTVRRLEKESAEVDKAGSHFAWISDVKAEER